MRRRERTICLILACLFAIGLWPVIQAGWGDRRLGTCGVAPPPKKQRVKAAEGFPPLPLPVVPLRRTETQRPPAPPTLIAKIKYGTTQDWTPNPGDLAGLLRWAQPLLRVRYTWTNFDLAGFLKRHSAISPASLPVLFIAGHDPFQFSDRERTALRRFLKDGGFLIGDSACGPPSFQESFRAEMKKMFPGNPLHRLPPDHPIYHSFFEIQQVPVWVNLERNTKPPCLEGIDIACRTAVIFSPIDLSCGWEGHRLDRDWHGVNPKEAVMLGTNILAYILASHHYGMVMANAPVYRSSTKQTRGRFVVAQLKHAGSWDPDHVRVGNLLRMIEDKTNCQVRLERKAASISDPDLFSYPFLYLTGHEDFSFSDSEVAILRQYLTRGGFLLADACCGRKSFDLAFRREIKRIFPNHPLTYIPATHPIFTSFHRITQVEYSPWVSPPPEKLDEFFEGIEVGGNLVVLYSRLALGGAWKGVPCPYSKGVAVDDGFKLGTNIVTYVLMH